MNRPTSERVDLTATSSTGCKILVTGSAGFIGAHVVAAIAERGIESIGLIRPGGVARGKGHTSPSVEADYHDAEATKSALRAVAPDVLVHAAWRLAEGSRYLADPTNIAELRASLRLFELAHEVGCRRIVGIGTCLE